MEQITLGQIARLDERIKRAISPFRNHACAATLCDQELGKLFGEIPLYAGDILTIGALAGVHVLLVGSSGRGKTQLAELFSRGAFGEHGYFLQKLNPHLTEELFANVDMKKLRKSSIREAIEPAPFLSLPCTILDEINRTPPALTNILLGFLDGTIQLKCGLQRKVGIPIEGRSAGDRQTYHFVIGSMNEGREYGGTFEMDTALSERLALRIPFDVLRPTARDRLEIVEGQCESAEHAFSNASCGSDHSGPLLAELNQSVLRLPLDPLALVYMTFLSNQDTCPSSATGFHTVDQSQALCTSSQCRILKWANGFCPANGAPSERSLRFLRRAASAAATLRAARTLERIDTACASEDGNLLRRLRTYARSVASGEGLRQAATRKYAEGLCVTVDDVKAMLPFLALGGKVPIAKGFVAKYFEGSEFLAAQHYVRETYAQLEHFLRENRELCEALGADAEEAAARLASRLEYSSHTVSPAIARCIGPLLERRRLAARSPQDVADEIQETNEARQAVRELVP